MSLKEILDNNISKPWANLFINSLDAEATIQNNNLVVGDSLSLPFVSNSYLYAGSTGTITSRQIVEADVQNLPLDLSNIYTDVNALFLASSSNANNVLGLQAGVSGLQQKTTDISYINQGLGITGTNITGTITTNGFGDGSTNVFIGRGAGGWFNSPSTSSNVVITTKTGNATGTNPIQNSVIIGHNAAFNMTGPADFNGNVIIGQLAGAGLTGGVGNVIVGRNAQALSAANVSNAIVIGTNANAALNNEIVIAAPGSNVMRGMINNTIDIGSSSIAYKDAYFTGTILASAIGTTTATLTLPGIVVIPSQAYFKMVLFTGITLIMTANTWRLASPLNNFSTQSNLFTNSTTLFNSIYTGVRSRLIELRATFSFTVSNNNSLVSVFFSINGNIVLSPNTVQSIVTAVTNNSVTYIITLHDQLTLNVNDTIGVAIQSSTSTTITFTSGCMIGSALSN